MAKENSEHKEFSGKAIYRPKGRAGEYARWAANLYVGCSNGCTYCYCKKGVLNHAMGADQPVLKACFRDEHHAIWTFRYELLQNKTQIMNEGGIFLSFSTDPCLRQTWRVHLDCIMFALALGIPVTILTKCTGWMCDPYSRVLWTTKTFKDKLCVGFTLTGMDDLEPEASSNDERIEAMEVLHDKGIHTFASIEPVIDLNRSLEMISRTRGICDLYKIGLLTGEKRNYTVPAVKDFVTDVMFMSRMNPSLRKVYFKDSVLDMIYTTREKLHQMVDGYGLSTGILADAEYDIFKSDRT